MYLGQDNKLGRNWVHILFKVAIILYAKNVLISSAVVVCIGLNRIIRLVYYEISYQHQIPGYTSSKQIMLVMVRYRMWWY